MSKISVVICTYNRAENLKETLRALDRQITSEDFEIVVIDNNSTDSTKKVIHEFSVSNQRQVRYFFELAQGVSFARNRGIRESAGEFIAFLDDDVIPAENWIQSISNAFSQYQADCLGGPVLPEWPGNPPLWPFFKDGISGVFGLLDRGSEVIQTNEYISNFLLGGNIAYRTSIFDKVGLFRIDLGRTATHLGGGEDSDMIQRALKTGKLAVYDPKISVHHKIPEQRMQPAYFRKWHFDMGRTTAKISKFRRQIYWSLLVDCCSSGLFTLVYRIVRIKQKALLAEGNFLWKLGMLVELIQFSKRENVCQLSAS